MDLLLSMRAAVRATVPPGKVGVAFSGGVDSALLALLCRQEGYEVTALTVGMADSPDLRGAPAAAAECRLCLRTAQISGLEERLWTGKLSWAENAVAFEYIFELAAEEGIKTVAAANGIDELFCGYDMYRRRYHEGPDVLESMMHEKMRSEEQMFIDIEKAAKQQGVTLVQPFMSAEFAKDAMRVPLRLKITGSDDMLRKHAVREAALRCGVPGRICARPKKALQYGSGIHRAALKTARRRGVSSAPPKI